MEINKQDIKLLQEVAKKYKQGLISGLVQGEGVILSPLGCRDNIISSTGGGGGSQDLQQTLTNGNTTGGKNISVSEGDVIVLDNGSMLRKGTIDAGFGGNNGIALRCSVDYEMKWEAGRLYVLSSDGFTIRQSLYNFTNTPTVDDDETKGYVVGSVWGLDNGDTYICTDATTGSAAWIIGGGGSYIPLSGTDLGSPVFGDIQIMSGLRLKTLNEDNDAYNHIQLTEAGVVSSVTDANGTTTFIVSQGEISVNTTDPYGPGLVGAIDFTPVSSGNPLVYAQQSYVGFRGTATLSSGTVTVSSGLVKTGMRIYVSCNTPIGTQGFLSAPTGSIVDATSFVINSTSATDDSTVNWWIAP